MANEAKVLGRGFALAASRVEAAFGILFVERAEKRLRDLVSAQKTLRAKAKKGTPAWEELESADDMLRESSTMFTRLHSLMKRSSDYDRMEGELAAITENLDEVESIQKSVARSR